MCYVITAAGPALLASHSGRMAPATDDATRRHRAPRRPAARLARGAPVAPGSPRRARRRLGARARSGRSGEPTRAARARGIGALAAAAPTADGQVALGPARSAPARRAHGARFPATDAAGERVEVERFETVRPDAIVEVRPASRGRAPSIDVIVELDDRPARGARRCGKLERYDHFLAGWSVHTRRYGRRSEALAAGGVRVPRPGAGARVRQGAPTPCCAPAAPTPGEYPFDWEYPGQASGSCSRPSATCTRACCVPTACPSAAGCAGERGARRSSRRGGHGRATRDRRSSR